MQRLLDICGALQVKQECCMEATCRRHPLRLISKVVDVHEVHYGWYSHVEEDSKYHKKIALLSFQLSFHKG